MIINNELIDVQPAQTIVGSDHFLLYFVLNTIIKEYLNNQAEFV